MLQMLNILGGNSAGLFVGLNISGLTVLKPKRFPVGSLSSWPRTSALSALYFATRRGFEAASPLQGASPAQNPEPPMPTFGASPEAEPLESRLRCSRRSSPQNNYYQHTVSPKKLRPSNITLCKHCFACPCRTPRPPRSTP
jgi:hypothetical protein